MDEKTVEQSMQLILHSGTGRSMVIEAVREMLKTGDIEAAKKKIEAGGKEIGEVVGLKFLDIGMVTYHIFFSIAHIHIGALSEQFGCT